MNPNVHSRMLSGHLLYIDFKRSFLIKYVAAHGCHIKKTFMAFTTLMKQIWKAVFEEGDITRPLSENEHLQLNFFLSPTVLLRSLVLLESRNDSLPPSLPRLSLLVQHYCRLLLLQIQFFATFGRFSESQH